MTLTQAILLAIVEGLTEFLPISSTGHLVMASRLLHIEQTEFVKTFEIFIQLGAILAVLTLYWPKLKLANIQHILAAFIPTAIAGLALYGPIKHSLLGNIWVTLAAMFLGGLVLLFIDRLTIVSMPFTFKTAFTIGLFQAVAIIPGVSRAAAAIVGGQLAGLVRKQAVEFSFLLALPTIFAATTFDLVKTLPTLQINTTQILVLWTGFFVAFITAVISIKVFVGFVQHFSLAAFGWYRVIAALLFLTYLT